MVLNTKTIALLLLAVACGIYIGTDTKHALPLFFLILLLGTTFLFLTWITRERVYLFSVVMLIFLGGGILLPLASPPVRDSEVDRFVGGRYEIVGDIVAQPDKRMNSTSYVLRLTRIDEKNIPSSTLVEVSLPKYPAYEYGDTLSIRGILEFPEDFSTDPLRPPFPYVRFLAKDGIGYVLRSPSVLGERENTDRMFLAFLSSIKQRVVSRVELLYQEPEGGLLSGILLGEKHALSEDLLEDFRVSGLVHVIVVSGYNMTVIAEWVGRLFQRFPVIARSGIGIMFIWIYAGIVGGGAPVIRASLMTSLALFARMTGRTGDALRLLLLAVFVMLIQNPRILRDDPSFHLSFLATLGLILIAPRIVKWLGTKKYSRMNDLLASTLAAQIAVVPYILSYSGLLSPYGLLANMLALPVIPFAMGFGALSLLLSLIHKSLGLLGAFLTTPLLSWVLFIGKSLAEFPGSHLSISPFPFWISGLFYGILGFFLWKRNVVHVAKEEKDHDSRNKRN